MGEFSSDVEVFKSKVQQPSREGAGLLLLHRTLSALLTIYTCCVCAT